MSDPLDISYRRPTVEDTAASEYGFAPSKSRASPAKPARRTPRPYGPKSPSDSGYSSQSHASIADAANSTALHQPDRSDLPGPSQSRAYSPAPDTNTLVRRPSKTRSDTGSRPRRSIALDEAHYAASQRPRPRLATANIPRSTPKTTPTTMGPPSSGAAPYSSMAGQYPPAPPYYPPPPGYRYSQGSATAAPLGPPGSQQSSQPLPSRSASFGNYLMQQPPHRGSIPRTSPVSPFTHQPAGPLAHPQSLQGMAPGQRPRPMSWATEPSNLQYQGWAPPSSSRAKSRQHSHSNSRQRSIVPMKDPRIPECHRKEGKHVHRPNKRFSETKGRTVLVNCCKSCCSSESESSDEDADYASEPVREPSRTSTLKAERAESDDENFISGDIKIVTRTGEEKLKSFVINKEMYQKLKNQAPLIAGGKDGLEKRRAITIQDKTPAEPVKDKARIAQEYQDRVTQSAQQLPGYMADTFGQTSKASSSRRESYEPPQSPTRSQRSDFSGAGFSIRSPGDLNIEDGHGVSYTVPAREGAYAEIRVNDGRKEKDYVSRSDVSRSSRRSRASRGSRSSPPLDTIVESSSRQRRPTTQQGGN